MLGRPTRPDDDDTAADDAELEAQIMACAEEAVEWGAEGLMAKPLDGVAGHYRAGTRTKSWMKLKKDFDGRLGGDTLDLVPIAACVASCGACLRRPGLPDCPRVVAHSLSWPGTGAKALARGSTARS